MLRIRHVRSSYSSPPSPPQQHPPSQTCDCRSFLRSLKTAKSRRIIVIYRHVRGPLLQTSYSARTSNRTDASNLPLNQPRSMFDYTDSPPPLHHSPATSDKSRFPSRDSTPVT